MGFPDCYGQLSLTGKVPDYSQPSALRSSPLSRSWRAAQIGEA